MEMQALYFVRRIRYRACDWKSYERDLTYSDCRADCMRDHSRGNLHTAWAEEYEASMQQVVKTLTSEAGAHRLKRIAVAEFVDLEGSLTSLSRFLADELASALAKEKSLVVVDRQQVARLLKVRPFTTTEELGPDDLTKLGQATGIDAVVTGSVVELSDTVRLTAKLIEVRTARLTASAKTTFAKIGVLAELSQGPVKSKEMSAKQKTGAAPAEALETSFPDDMVLVPAGKFLYGEGEAQHTITLPDFVIDLFEVTNADYDQVRSHKFEADKAYHPVTDVNWTDAGFFCRAKGKRLPSEQEWEKAARGVDGRPYPWGSEFAPSRVNGNDRHAGTTPIGQFPEGRSPYGVQDMAGNVMEWTNSAEDGAKVFRGGSWASSSQELRVTFRNKMAASYGLFNLGFRCAKNLAP